MGLQGQEQGEDGGGRTALSLPAATGPSGSSELSLSGCRVILTSKWQCQPHGTQPAWRVGKGSASRSQESTPMALEGGLSNRPGTDAPPRLGHSLMEVTGLGAGGAGEGGSHTQGAHCRCTCYTSHGPTWSKDGPQTAHHPHPPPDLSSRCLDFGSVLKRTLRELLSHL